MSRVVEPWERAVFLDLLANSVDRPWVHHGLGFIKLNLQMGVRVHIWDDRLKTRGATPLHDHPWSFESSVITGRLINIRYKQVDELGVGLPYHKSLLHCGEPESLQKAERVLLIPQEPELYSTYPADANYEPTVLKGARYTQRAAEIHETIAESGTISVISRVFQIDPADPTKNYDKAHVFWPFETTFGEACQQVATMVTKQEVIKDALKRYARMAAS